MTPEVRPICSRTYQQLPTDTSRCQKFVPERRHPSLSEPACAFPTLTGAFSGFVPENRLYREKSGADVRPCDAAFGNGLPERMNMDIGYRRQINQRSTP